MKKKLFFCFLLMAIVQGAIAEEAENGEALKSVRSRINSANQNRQFLQHKKDALDDQLGEVEKLYGRTAALLRELQAKVVQKRNNLIKIRQEIAALKGELAQENKELAGQIKAAYVMGQKEKLKLLLNQQDPAVSSRIMVYYDYLNKARLAKLAAISEAVVRMERLNEQKHRESELLEKDLERKQAEQQAVKAARKERAKLLARLHRDFSSNEEQITRLKESESKLKSLVASLQRSSNEVTFEVEQARGLRKAAEQAAELSGEQSGDDSDFPKLKGDFQSLKGLLPWPVKGRLTNKFGSVRTESTESIWDGVLIDASEGTEIRAITSGKVAYADWLRNYGLLIILDHGKGYMSLYAFNQSLYRKVGDWVDVGDVIASVGQSGGRSRSGLYFSIRNHGKPVDPIQWCRK